MKTTTSNRTKAIAGAALAAACFVSWLAYSDLYAPYIINVLRVYGPSIGGGVAFVVAGLFIGLQQEKRDAYGSGWYIIGGIVAIIGGIVAMLTIGIYGSYLADKAYLDAGRQITGNPIPQMDVRAPYQLSADTVSGARGDLVGDPTIPVYLPGEGVWVTTVDGPGYTRGTSGIIVQDLDGKTTTQCSFDNEGSDGYRLGGWFDANIAREIAHIDRGLLITSTDSYGYCDGDVAVVAVPVKKLEGIYPALEVPAGVAVYRADTGKVELLDSVEAGEIPGPVYPQSIAARQRAAFAAEGASFIQWLREKKGYVAANNGDDENSVNATEIHLNSDQGPVFVTAMTTRPLPGSGPTQVTGYTVVSSGEVTDGKLAPITFHTIERDSRPKPVKLVAGSLSSVYSDADFGWANGLEIVEIVPTGKNGEVVASFVQGKVLKFRAFVQTDGSSCLVSASGATIRCVDANGDVVGGDTDDIDAGGDTDVPDGELSELTDAELTELAQAVTDEVLRRLADKASK